MAASPSDVPLDNLQALREMLHGSLKSVQERRKNIQQQFNDILDQLGDEEDAEEEKDENEDHNQKFWHRVASYFQPIGPEQLELCQPAPEPPPISLPLDATFRPSRLKSPFTRLDPGVLRSALASEQKRKPTAEGSKLPLRILETDCLYTRLMSSVVECASGQETAMGLLDFDELPSVSCPAQCGPLALLCAENAILHQLRQESCIPHEKINLDMREDDELSAEIRQCHKRLVEQVTMNNTRKALLQERLRQYRRREEMKYAVMKADRDLERAYRKRKRHRSKEQMHQHFHKASIIHEARLKEAMELLESDAEGDIQQLWEQTPEPLFTSDLLL